MANTDGSIVLSVSIDTDTLKTQTKKLNDEILKAVKSESKITQEAEKANQAILKTQLYQERVNAAVYKTLEAENSVLASEEKLKAAKEKTAQETAKTESAIYKSLEAEQKAVNAEQALKTEKAKTAAETSKAETAEINTFQAAVKTATAIQNQNSATERTYQEIEKTKQAQEKTRQSFEKTAQAQEKTKQSVQKTTSEIEKTAQAQEKTKQSVIATEKAQRSLNEATTKVTLVMTKLASTLATVFGIREITRFSNEASKLASQQEANLKRLGMLYGEYGQSVYDFAQENATAFGMSKVAAYDAAADYGNIFTTFEDGAESAKLTNQMLQATAVIASQTGRTYEDVFEKIRSGLYGNTRAIDDLGLSVRQSSLMQTKAYQQISQNGTKSWNDLTDAELQNARALGIIEQANAKYGNTILQSTALTRSQFNAAWEDFKATWGTAVNKVLSPILAYLTKVLNTLTQAMSAAFKFFGKETQTASDGVLSISNNSKGISDNIDKATESQKKLNKEITKSLAGFDEIQILGKSESSPSESEPTISAVAPASVSSADFSEKTTEWDDFFASLQPSLDELNKKITDIYNSIKKIALLFTKGFWDGFVKPDFGTLKKSIDDVSDDLQGIFSSEEVQTSVDGFANSVAISLGQITGSVTSIGTTIATNLANGFSQYIDNNYSFIKDKIADIFDVSDNIATSVGNTFSAFSTIFSELAGGENGTTLTSAMMGIFSNVSLGIADIALNAGEDFINFLTQPIIDNQDKIGLALDDVLAFFSGNATSIESLCTNLVNNAVALYNEHISPLIQSITDTVSAMVDSLLDAWNTYVSPVMEQVQERFETLVEEHLKPMFDKITTAVSKLVDLAKWLWDTALGPLIEKIWDDFIKRVLQGVAKVWNRISRVVNNVAETLSDLVGDISDILGGIIDFLTGTFKGDWEKAWGGLKSIFKGVLNGIVDIAEGLINTVIDGLNSFVVDGLNAVIEPISDLIGADWKIGEIKHVSLPHLARGAVLPANNPFLAVVGDQKRGTNIEAPAELIKQMVNEALDERGAYDSQGVDVSINFEGTEARLIRYLSPKISKVNKYRGKNLLTGGQV